MDDFSHVGYHRGDWFKWVGFTLLLMAAAAAVIALFSRIGMHDRSGNTTLPPDWPRLGYTVDSRATDVHFDPDIRSILGAGRLVVEKTGKTSPHMDSLPEYWHIHFNHPDQPDQLLAATDQQLQAAGWVNRGGRTMEFFPQTGLLDTTWEDPSGKYKLMLRYWSKPPRKYGSATNQQHWHVTISEIPY